MAAMGDPGRRGDGGDEAKGRYGEEFLIRV